ncbi:reverse transcriptase [Cucumis melo var. makuwa]|uniref:Reverse transcriptase n=1 Tax=Cucumis melo var. makuwa TaxID=1194695 RepID=A0A5D3CJ99_CUCMM|nr:reverse transcriptase [Cucumis melo var. makuwa]
MAGRREGIPATGDNREQEEVEENAALSPRTSTVCFLAVEDSLGDLHEKFDRVMDTLETLTRRMDGLPALARIEANANNDRNDGNRGGRRARRNFRNLPNQRNDQRKRPMENPLRYADNDSMEEYEAWQNGQECDSSSSDEQGNIWNDNRDMQMRQVYRGHEAQREVHHDYKMKIDLPTYKGKHDLESFLDWIENTENFFNYMDTFDRKKVHLVALKLRGGASAWWDQVEINRQRYGKPPICSWEKMKKLMKARFLPPNYEQTLYNQYQNCRQGSKSVAEYIKEFHKLSARTNLKTVEEMMAARLRNTNRKTTWETDFSKKQSYSNKTNEQPSTSVAEKSKDVEAQEATKKKENAGKGKVQNNYNRPSLGKCFRCDQTSYLSNTCPQRKTIALAEEEYDSARDDSKTVEEETKCTINGKVCDVIIDSGSSENFIAKTLVTTLNLKAETHPNPFKIGWVNKGGETLVSEICTVPLSIGSGYKDQIICDVIDMDVCHLLLGRPWQHDTQTLHKGRENTYEFYWMGKKIVLLPLSKNNGAKHMKTKGQLFTTVGGKKLISERERDILRLVVVDKSIGEQRGIMEPELQQLLAEFPHLKKEPHGLPRLRDIQHQIDLIPEHLCRIWPTIE